MGFGADHGQDAKVPVPWPDYFIRVRGDGKDLVAVDRWWYYLLLVAFWLNFITDVASLIAKVAR